MTSATVVRTAVLGPDQVADLRRWLDEVEAWPAGSHQWGHYAEATATGPVICRTENVSACHPGIAAIVDGPLLAVAAAHLGEDVVAFKDKVNYKQPGGAGFLPHQDLPAYPGADRVISVLLAVDACTEASGCLFLADPTAGVLPTDDRGVIDAAATEALTWFPAELGAGDAACIDGLAPHHSGPNRSQRPRRVLVASYAPVGGEYTRTTYYRRRAETMAAATARDGLARISTHADFAGDQLAPDTPAQGRCTH